MKNNKILYDKFTKIGRNGYLVVPRNLLKDMFELKGPFTEVQAYMYLYMQCEFCDRIGKDALKRGQMTCTAAELADRFCWSKSAVRRFLYHLQQMEVVKLETMAGLKSRLTLCFYEALTGGHGRPVVEKEKVEFFQFWKSYYNLLDRTGSDYYAAQSVWERMGKEERRMAVENVEAYFRSLCDMRFVKTAGNYLRFKAYVMPESDKDI